jgi:prevent-host-death family protein
MSTVGIRALRQNASAVVRRAAAGDVVTITDRGRPVAQIVPFRKSRLAELRDAGLVREASIAPADLPLPTARVDGASLSAMLDEARDDERY